MKKITLVVTALLAMFSVNVSAQKVEKAKAGSFGTEVQFNPFDQNGHTFSLDALKFRYFLTDNDALRLKLGFGFASAKLEDDEDGAALKEGKTKSGDFNLDLGYERHFDIAKRLDLYAGAQIGIFKHFASTTASVYDPMNDEYYDVEYKNCATDGNDLTDLAYFGVAFSVFTGLDFYIYKGLYIGTELGLYINSYKTNETEITVDDVTTKGTETIRTTNVNFDIEPTIRLGWTF